MDFKAAGELILQAREAKGLTRRALALKAGINFTYVSKLENGTLEYAPKPDVLQSLVLALGLDVSVHAKLKQHYGHAQPAERWPSTVLLPDYAG